jgi:hypothetical protein
MAMIDVVITVGTDALDRMPELVSTLEGIGLQNIQSLAAIGMITGSLDEARLAEAAALAGVADVQAAQEYRLPPGDAPTEK